MISKRYAKANNPYMKDYDPSKPIIYIWDIDANNLYGWAMSKPLPIGGFENASKEEVENGNWRDIQGGYITEADLRYGKHLHDRQIGRASCRERCRSRWSPYH